MVTFDEARAIVAENRSSYYPAEADYQVAPWGYENADVWVIISGSYAEVFGPRNDEDLNYVYIEDGPCTTVDKLTGAYVEHWGTTEEGFGPGPSDTTPVDVRPKTP